MSSFSSQRRRLRVRQSGLTLIELGISLVIVGLLFAAVIPSIEGVTGVRARESTAKMAGMVRYMYNESALSGRPCRMTFDLDQRMYWAECTDNHFVLNTERERSRDGHSEVDRKRDFTASSNDGFAIDDADQAKKEKERIEKDAEFHDFTSDEIDKQKLPAGVDLSVWVDHQTEKYKTGKAYLYFFPQGYTERAQIYLTSGDTVYTLKVSPLTGKSRVEPRELDLPRDVF
jgi:general secretion pathway protein H